MNSSCSNKEELIAGIRTKTMTLEEKVGQLFIISPEDLDKDYNLDNKAYYSLTNKAKETYAKYPCGGFILFDTNIDNPEQLKNLTSELRSLSGDVPFIAIDEEGGMVARIANNPGFDVKKFGNMSYIGQTGNADNAYDVGYTIGSYLKEYGITVDFAPVGDINTNPNNIVIGERAFGSDPYAVNWMIQSVIFGLHDTGTLSCVKHYPGHGDTSSDTHTQMAYTNKTWDELLNYELVPFIAGIEANTDFIMVGHIAAENVTGDELPSSLSRVMITEKLRNELNYDGLIITDSLEMGAITNNYDPLTASVMAINAGVDIVLLPGDYIEVYQGVLDAVKNGIISEERIDESVNRILKVKEKLIEKDY